MTDLHSHVLPGIDDGSRTAEESRAILTGLRFCGVRRLALTPHYYPAKNNVPHFLKAREGAFQTLSSLPEAARFRFLKGAEVYFTESLFHAEDLRSLCFEGTDLMLVEPPERDRLSDALLDRLERLISSFGVTPLIAHIDRFPYLFRDTRALDQLREMGCRFQLNLPAAFDLSKRRTCVRLIREGRIDFLGNDLHRPIPDPALFAYRLKSLRMKVGAAPFQAIEERAKLLFSESR